MLNDKLTEICERLDWSIYLDANENNEQARLPERLEDVAALFHKEAAQ